MADTQTEREFLHAIANTLAIAVGMVDFSASALSQESMTAEDLKKVKARLEKAQAALSRTTELLQARRELLIQQTSAQE